MVDAPIRRVAARVFRIPTDAPEADGTIAWNATTMVVADGVAARLAMTGQWASGSGRSWKCTTSGLDWVAGVAPGAPGAGASMPSM